MVGINKYSEKERREQRRRNHIAKDLWSGKFQQQVIPSQRKRKFLNTESEGYFEWDENND